MTSISSSSPSNTEIQNRASSFDPERILREARERLAEQQAPNIDRGVSASGTMPENVDALHKRIANLRDQIRTAGHEDATMVRVKIDGTGNYDTYDLTIDEALQRVSQFLETRHGEMSAWNIERMNRLVTSAENLNRIDNPMAVRTAVSDLLMHTELYFRAQRPNGTSEG